MPIAKFQMPDGRVARFEVPEGTTAEQAQAQMQNMFQSGQLDARTQEQQTEEEPSFIEKAGQAIAPFLKPAPLIVQEQLQKLMAEPERTPEEQAAAERALANLPENIPFAGMDTGIPMPEQVGSFMVGAGKGLKTIGRAVGLAEPATGEEQQYYEKLAEAAPVATTAGEIAGESAPFLPLGLGAGGAVAKLGQAAQLGAKGMKAAQVASTGLTGALEAGAIARGQGANVGQQLYSAGIGGSIAGALELALPVIGRIGGKIIRRVLGKSPKGAVLDATGKPSQEFLEALQESGQTFDDVINEAQQTLKNKAVDPKEAARKAFLESQGINPTQAQISRTADDFMAQQEAAKTSTAVREALEKQDAILTTRFNNKVLETGGDVTAQSSSVVDFITDRASVLDQEISDLYAAARKTLPGEKNIRFENLAKKLRELYKSDRAAGGRIKAVIGEMQAKQILDKKGKLVGRINVEDAEDLRKFMNELYDETNPFGNGILRKLKDSLDDDVFNAAGKDYFNQARKAKASFESELTRSKIHKFDKRKANLVRDVLENKVDPNKLSEDVVFKAKWRGEDLQQLKDYLHLDKEAGGAAWNDLRADVMEQIKEKALGGPAGQGMNQSISRNRLEKAIKSIGSKKLDILFNNEEKKFLRDMLEVAKLREPVAGTALGRGPSAQAISRLETAIKKLPLMESLFDIVDKEGRKVLRAKPKVIRGEATRLGGALTDARAALAPVAGAGIATQEQQ